MFLFRYAPSAKKYLCINIFNKKMRIGIVCYPTFGGSGVVATELGMALADKKTY